jgi:hypothetical protein
VSTEFAGAIDLDPPLTADELGYVRRLARHDDPARRAAWTPSRDGTSIAPRKGADVARCRESLRQLLSTMERPSRFGGMVVAFDRTSRELVAITVARGRVTQRTLRSSRARRTSSSRSNVIDLAARRRIASRAIS